MGIQERWEILTKSIWEVGKEQKMVKVLGDWKAGGAGGERDEDIKAQKESVWAALKRWINTRREEDREELKKERKRLKEIRREKEVEAREKKKK